ncbi:MAG: sugar ABC transporter permease [Microbacterium sp.]
MPYALLSPTIALIAVLMLVPIVMVIAYSFMARAVTKPDTTFVGFDNYIEVLSDGTFYQALGQSLFFTVASVAAHFVLGMAFALLLNSKWLNSHLATVLRALYVLPWVFTVAVVAVLWRMILNPSGVLNGVAELLGLMSSPVEWLADPAYALISLTLVNIWAGYPFFMVSLLAGLQGLPHELYEAARIDGAGPVRSFSHMTLPLLKPVITSLMLLDFIWTSQQFPLIWLMTGGGPGQATVVAPIYVYKLAFSEYEFAIASAAAVVVLLLSLILAVFYVRHQRKEDH